MIHAEDITFQYPTAESPSLHDISFDVAEGEVVGIVGPSESGKTTLSMILAGLAPSVTGGWREGHLDVAGCDPHEEDTTNVGLVFEDYSSQLTQVRVIDEILVPLLSRGMDRQDATARAEELLSKVRLDGYQDRRTWELSGGEQQRVAIAAILALDPEVIIFDTALDMLDPKGQTMVSELISSLAGDTSLVVTVDDPQRLIGIADQVLLLANGRIVADGDPDTILRSSGRFEKRGLAPPTCVELAAELDLSEQPLTTEELIQALEHGNRSIPSTTHPSMQDGAFGKPIIELDSVTYSYQEGKSALTDVDITVRAGEVHAIVGGNGAGKTTVAKLFAGLLSPDHGTIEVRGKSVQDISSRSLGEHVGLVFQNPDAQVSKQTVEDEVRFPLENRQYERSRWLGRQVNKRYEDTYIEERTEAALETTGLRDDQVCMKDPTTLGLGYRRLTAIASALAPEPPAVVLDEPTAGLDASGKRRMTDIINFLKQDERGVVVVEHDMDFVSAVADRVTVLHDGAVKLEGSPREVFAPENWDWLREHYLMPPRFARLADRLGIDAVTKEHLVEALNQEGDAIQA